MQDSGPGIAGEVHARLFQPFTQADASTTRRHGGTGLGLAISRRLVSMMGGDIQVTSELGRGSTFTLALSLPCQLPQDSATLVPAGASALVVTHAPIARSALAEQLRVWGLRVETAGTDAAATRLVQSGVDGRLFSYIFLDSQLPGLRGGALSQALAADPAGSCAQVLLLTPLGKVSRASGLPAITTSIARPVRPAQLSEALMLATATTGPTPPQLHHSQLPSMAVAAPGQRVRLLVAEDNPVNQKVIRAMLDRLGYDADLVSDGRAAVEAALRQPYTAILMDCQMPETDGFEATVRLREQLKTHVPIIALTASVLDSDREHCRAVGMDDFLAKPIERHALAAALARWAPASPGREAQSA